MAIGINSTPPVGLGAKERLGSPGTLAGMIPNSRVQKVTQEDPSVYTDKQGDTNFSGGLKLQSKAPSQEPPLPGDVLLAQVKGKNIDAQA